MPRRGSKEAKEISARGNQIVVDAFKGQTVPGLMDAFSMLSGETANPLFLPNIPTFFGGDPIIPGTRQLSSDIGNVLFPGQSQELESQLDERFITGMAPPPETEGQATGRALIAGGATVAAMLPFGVAGGIAASGDDIIRTLPDTAAMGPFQFKPKVPPGGQVSGMNIVNQVDLPSPTSQGLLQDAAERAFQEGDAVTGTALRQELLRMEGSEQIIDAASRRAAENAGLGQVSPLAEPIVAEQLLEVAQTQRGANAFEGAALPKSGKRQLVSPGIPAADVPKSFLVEDAPTAARPLSRTHPHAGNPKAEIPEALLPGSIMGDVGTTPKGNVSLDVSDFFAGPEGGQGLMQGLDETAARTGTQVQRATGTLFGPGQQSANQSVNRGLAVEVPGFGAFRRRPFDPKMNAKLKDLNNKFRNASTRTKLTAEDKFFLSQHPELETALDDFMHTTAPKPADVHGKFIQSTQQAEGFENLIDQIFDEFLAAGRDPQKRATGGRIG